MQQNPYQPPGAPYAGPGGQGFGEQAYNPFVYKRLGWKTTITMVSLAGIGVGGLISAILAPFAEGEGENANVLMTLVAGAIGLGVGVMSLAAIVFFFIWIHGAATNVRAFGNNGLQISPGWCIGWWFIPFASMIMPYKAVSEIWRASDAEARQISVIEWSSRPTGGIVKIWWATYLISGLTTGAIAVAAMGGKPSPLALTVVDQILSLAAVVSVLLVLRGIDRRQDEMAMALRLTSA